jgi:hypothetical protein
MYRKVAASDHVATRAKAIPLLMRDERWQFGHCGGGAALATAPTHGHASEHGTPCAQKSQKKNREVLPIACFCFYGHGVLFPGNSPFALRKARGGGAVKKKKTPKNAIKEIRAKHPREGGKKRREKPPHFLCCEPK